MARVRVSRVVLMVSVVFTVAVLIAVAYSLNLLTPGFTVFTYVDGKPVDAYVQVFALLPPGTNGSLVEVWSGEAFDGFVRVPASAVNRVAEGWVGEGFGGEGVGLEFIATYVNGSTAYFAMQFTTYRPGDVINALTNPIVAAVMLNMATIRLNLTMTTEVPNHQSSINTPTTPPRCWWDIIQQWQSPNMQIPITWAVVNYPTIGLDLSAIFQQRMNYLAAVAVPQSVGTSYSLIGSTVSVSTNTYNATSTGFNLPDAGYLYQVGTLGFAKLQLVCWTGPTNTYAYEAYVESISNNGAIHPSDNATYIHDLLNEYEELTGKNLTYIPFDEVHVLSNGSVWSYYFSIVQQYSSPLGVVAVIPVGSLIAMIAPKHSIPPIAANLAAALQISTLSVISVAAPVASSYPAYGDVFVTAIPVVYSTPSTEYYYPYMLGFVLGSLGSYSSSTSMYVEGPSVIMNPCTTINSYNWTVYVYIGDTSLLVPGGNVTATVYNSNGVAIWSGTFSMWLSHQPITVSIPWTIFNYTTPNTYHIKLTYNGYTTPKGSITYNISTATITIHTKPQFCG